MRNGMRSVRHVTTVPPPPCFSAGARDFIHVRCAAPCRTVTLVLLASPSSSSSFSCDVSSTGMQCLLYADSLPQSPASPPLQEVPDVAEAAEALPPLHDTLQHLGQHPALDAMDDASDDDAYDDDVLRAFKVSAADAAFRASSRRPHRCSFPY